MWRPTPCPQRLRTTRKPQDFARRSTARPMLRRGAPARACDRPSSWWTGFREDRGQLNPWRIAARIGGKNAFDRNSRQPDGSHRLDATNGAQLATIDTW